MSLLQLAMKKAGFGRDRTNQPEEDNEEAGPNMDLLAEKKDDADGDSKIESEDEISDELRVASDEEIVTVYRVVPPVPQVNAKRKRSPAAGTTSGDSRGSVVVSKKRKAKKKKSVQEMEESPPAEGTRSHSRSAPSFITPASVQAPPPVAADDDSSDTDDDMLPIEDDHAAGIVGDGTPLPSPQRKRQASPLKVGRSAGIKAATEAKKKARQPPVRAGIWVKSRRSQLYHCVSADLQKYLPQEHPNFHNYYGTVVKKSRGRKAAYDIKFDVFRGNETAEGLCREIFTIVKKGEEEPPIDNKYSGKMQMEEEMEDKLVKVDDEIRCEKAFVKQDAAVLREVKSFSHQFHKNKPPIEWQILPADKDISDDNRYALMKEQLEEGAVINKEIDLQGLSNSELFLERFIPNVEGIAQRMDNYYKDPRAKYHATVRDRKMTALR